MKRPGRWTMSLGITSHRYSRVLLNGTPVPFILTAVVSFSVPAGKTPGAAY